MAMAADLTVVEVDQVVNSANSIRKPWRRRAFSSIASSLLEHRHDPINA